MDRVMMRIIGIWTFRQQFYVAFSGDLNSHGVSLSEVKIQK